MTVIAYRDGVMAADTMITDNGRVVGSIQKIARSPCGAIGAASGRGGAGQRFAAWMQAGMPGEFDPKCTEDGFFGALIMDAAGMRAMDRTGTILPFTAPFAAEGRGREVAIGAMEMGATTEQAVAAAIKWEEGCGGEIQIERLGEAV